MANTFRDTEQLYEVLDSLFERLSADRNIAGAFVAGNFVLRFRYREPEGQITVDLRQAPITWTCGDSALTPDLEMIQSADTAHQFWLGRLNVPRAIATRKVVSRGPIAKALKLLPAVKPVFPLYEQALRDLGYEHMLPAEQPARRATALRERVSGVLEQWLGALSSRRRGSPSVDLAALNAHSIPLVEEAQAQRRAPEYRDQNLPTDARALVVEMLRRMELIRAFEQRLSRAYADGEVPTEAIHLSIGQEAVAVGVCFALRVDDYIATTHRGHGHMLAKGADLDGMMSEMLARADGLCGGKGGSMHVTEASVGAIGANGIVGAGPLIAAGAAQSAKQRGTDQVAVAFVGDGATNQGMFHEAVNFAAVFDLPVLFVIENNQYGEFTSVERHCRVKRLSDRAAAYGIPGVTVDGNDVDAVYRAAGDAVARARRGEGPMILECLTYRWHGHMEGEQVPYRPADEIDAWKEKCPILRHRGVLREAGQLDEGAAGRLEAEAIARIEEAFSRAQASPEPTLDQVATDIYAPDPAYLYRPTPLAKTDREITMSQALYEALSEELARDESTYLMGEDVATGGYFAVTVGLVDELGTDRIIDTPISEYAIVGAAVGAAMTGRRPIAEILFSDFLTTCTDPIINQAAKLRYMSGGQYTMPLVVRTPGGAGLGMAAQHSQSLEALFTGIPGLIIVAPATPADAKGLLKASIRSNNPVLFFENKLAYAVTGLVPEGDYIVPIGVADVKRAGTDVTIVSVGAALDKALEAAAQLDGEGISVEVVDVRTLVPLDLETIARSVIKTGRLLTVEDGALCHGFGSEITARVVESCFDSLLAPPRRIAARDVPLAYNSRLERAGRSDSCSVGGCS